MGEPTTSEHHEPLWVPVAAPVIWVLHFMCCYIAAALWCGRFAGQAQAPPLRLFIVIATLLASTTISALFWRGLQRHRGGWQTPAYDQDTPEDRTRFIALTTMLLAGLSVLATLFVALGLWLVPSCY